MANTTNLDLVKPAGTDKALVSVLNSNNDKIDAWAGSTNQALSTQQAFAYGLLSASAAHTVNNADANNYKDPGTYYFTTGCSNVPGTYFLCTVINHTGGDFVIQFGARAAEKTRFYIRIFSSNSWAEWSEIAMK